jgi:NADH dehydrogenase (ubiquinone) 1 alpha subcomplex subunit 9
VIPYRGEESSYNHLKVMGDLGQIVPLKWDFRDKDTIRRAAAYSNVIINLTGSRWDTRNFTQRQAHVDSARAIAEVAKELDVERFIHVSALGADICPSEWGKTKVRTYTLSRINNPLVGI